MPKVYCTKGTEQNHDLDQRGKDKNNLHLDILGMSTTSVAPGHLDPCTMVHLLKIQVTGTFRLQLLPIAVSQRSGNQVTIKAEGKYFKVLSLLPIPRKKRKQCHILLSLYDNNKKYFPYFRTVMFGS